jgi:hypothetical protein
METKDSNTYVNLKTADGISLEIDLVSFRQKGEQVKFLSISILKEEKESEQINLDEQGFLRLKEFFSSLSWEL